MLYKVSRYSIPRHACQWFLCSLRWKHQNNFFDRFITRRAVAVTWMLPVLLLVWVLPLSSSIYINDLKLIEETSIPLPGAKQAKITKLINFLVSETHYRKFSLDDEFSERIMEKYISTLDPSRVFFLAEDVESIQHLQHQIDDLIKQGNVEMAYYIFDLYQARVTERIEYSLNRLEQPFDFTLNETLVLDRKNADWAQTTEELDDHWRKRIKNDIINLRLSGKKESELYDVLAKRYLHIARRTRQSNTDDVFQFFINAYVSTIEPHTIYYSPRGAENFKIHLSISLEGIGAILQTDYEFTLVTRILPGGPADISGALKADDRIIGIGQNNEDMVDIIGWRLDDVVELIRGPRESVVRLEILPSETGVNGESKIISITRDQIKLEEQAASSRILEVSSERGNTKIGVITLPSFYSDFDGFNNQDQNYNSTTRDVLQLLAELHTQNIDGLVVDLRGNGGGALFEAVALTGLFIKKGPIVQIQNSKGDTKVDYDPDPEIKYDGPLMVLVDRYSASASEIFAGAIQDYNRGLILGEPTFGKGTVQNLINLNRYSKSTDPLGQLTLTTAQFFRVSGDSTQFRGVIPDIIWPTSETGDNAGERSYNNAIPWRQIEMASYFPFQAGTNTEVLNQIKDNHITRVESNPIFQYTKEINKLNRENRELGGVNLSESGRREQRRQRDQMYLKLENIIRLAAGKPAYSSIESFETEQSKQRNEHNLPDDETKPDVFLLEAGNILSDYVYFHNRQKTLVNRFNNYSEDALNN